MKQTSRVYFLKPVGKDGPIKIGCSILPESRLAQIAVWSPLPLELIGSVPGTLKEEMRLHACFAHTHSHREWFHSAPDLRETIQTILADGTTANVLAKLKPTGNTRPNLPRRKRTEAERLLNKYRCAIRATQNRLRKLDETGAWYRPTDVNAIMSNWGSLPADQTQMPSAKELQRLDAYLADPVNHSIVPSWRRPKDPICIPIFAPDLAPAEQGAA